MEADQINGMFLRLKQEVDRKIADNKELIHAQVELISFIVASSVFDFNLLETRLDDIIFKEYILNNAPNDANLYDLRYFKEEVLRGGFIDFNGKVKIVAQILDRRKIKFNKNIFLDLAGLRNQIAHGIQNFDPNGKLGVEICLYGRKMEKIDFQELGERFKTTKDKATIELDNVYRKLGMFVANDAVNNK